MDIGGALEVVVQDRASTAKCPLAAFARDLQDTEAASAREAAAVLLKKSEAEVEEADLRGEQYVIARDKLRAELQRIDALVVDAQAARSRAAATASFCRAVISSGFQDRSSSAGLRSGSAATGGTSHHRSAAPPSAEVLGRPQPQQSGGAHHNAPNPNAPMEVTAQQPTAEPSLAHRSDAPADAFRSGGGSNVIASAIAALSSEVEVKESALLPLLTTLEADASRVAREPWSSSNEYDEWADLAGLLWANVLAPRPPVQYVEVSTLKHILRRSALDVPDGRVPIADRSLQRGCDCASVLHKLLGSVNDDVHAEALEVVTQLASAASYRDELVGAGLVVPVVKIVETSNSEAVLERALTALWTFAVSDLGKVAIREARGLAAVLSLLFSDSLPILDNVAMALGHLTRDNVNKTQLRGDPLHGMEKLVAMLLHPTESIRNKTAGAIWNCASDHENRKALLRLGVVPLLCEQLGTTGVQENAAGALWNLALEDEGKKSVLEFGGLRPLIDLLQVKSEAVVENVTGTLWNCSATLENRAAMRKFGAIPPLVSLLRSTHDPIRENAAGAIRNLVINDQNKVAFREAGGIELLVDLLDGAWPTLLEKFMSTLWILTVTPENKHALRHAGGFAKILNVLRNPNPPASPVERTLLERALSVLRNCSAVTENVKPLTEEGAVPAALQAAKTLRLLSRPDKSEQVREAVTCLLANIVREDKAAAAAAGALTFLTDMLEDRHEPVLEYASAGIASLTSNMDENRREASQLPTVPRLAAQLRKVAQDPNASPGLLHNTLLAMKHVTSQNDENLRQLLGSSGGESGGSIVDLLLGIIQHPPSRQGGGAGWAHTEDTVREAVFCLRNVAAVSSGADAIRNGQGSQILSRTAEAAQSDGLKIAISVVHQLLQRHQRTTM